MAPGDNRPETTFSGWLSQENALQRPDLLGAAFDECDVMPLPGQSVGNLMAYFARAHDDNLHPYGTLPPLCPGYHIQARVSVRNSL